MLVLPLDGIDEHFATRPACPFDAILDLLGRVRFGENVADEVLGKVRIVSKPMTTIPLVPTLELRALGAEVRWRHIGMARARSLRSLRP